jgi:hypothetical protein
VSKAYPEDPTMRQTYNKPDPKTVGGMKQYNHADTRGKTIFLNRESDTNDLLELFFGMIQVFFDEVDEF